MSVTYTSLVEAGMADIGAFPKWPAPFDHRHPSFAPLPPLPPALIDARTPLLDRLRTADKAVTAAESTCARADQDFKTGGISEEELLDAHAGLVRIRRLCEWLVTCNVHTLQLDWME
jgi:hypothetical protein